ncbi:hypothetical protein SSX86_003886 [Deinandra increscens subsp. villosa]|uniref:Uncharacterized protein n=1 Tax=Deinandra increscens subsp. villosa TaxID=3103831 RepID=A0AAP0DJ70_9ASTR
MLDDGDEIDWEAAVAEIDAACARKLSSSSSSSSAAAAATPDSHTTGSCPKTQNDKSSSRQSTLDGYFGLKHSSANAPPLCNHNHDDNDDESVPIDPEAAKFWIYPEHPPVRDYQVSITETALFSNTLVSLPTGLGKTLIAAVVMYNYHKWFPKGVLFAGKIVFTAPSRPLVMQQIEACHNIVGIPQGRTIELTGQTNPSIRASLWKDKQIFFVTPQVLEKDIQSGSCPVKQIVCLVIDEAHRASGNYSYCVAVRELMAVPVHLRILALTATPGSNHQTVQQVIDNLQISFLEYRSENDPDVLPYVHDREVEVIQVEMGKDAVEANKLLMDVMRVHVKKLSDIGLLQKRDPQTFSPVDFINSRDKFHQFPPHDLAEIRYTDVEGSFAILITLYHIKKLLSAHGIGPAFEMLEEKLKQGHFARLMSRNEIIHKAKVIMQQNLSHGSHSPKFSKLLEVLVEHFQKHDPQKSRVIIFSHFRGSVRDIIISLKTIGEYVKAVEFVGQNSGRTLKGQSQKVQQAVLQKFRAGEYNVIVSTSIGEEGLDIMEVDLVICFDANVSPLRMIQRMGRTGRKSKGRVDILFFYTSHVYFSYFLSNIRVCLTSELVLACEGVELKGYKSKQAKGKAVNKHMVNAGKSFRFHSSPRMVPHAFRPEKKLLRLSIEEFVPRGKKVKEDDAIQIPKYKLQLTDVETDLLVKYFDPAREDNWRPSLIAFPHFQAFPSRVHKIAHSTRTTMLIDTMQYLQGLSFNGKDEETSKECFKVETLDHHNSNSRGNREGLKEDLAKREPETDASSLMDTKEKNHFFLFGSNFTTVDSNGSILILSVPCFPLKQCSPTKSSISHNTLFLNCLRSDNSSHSKASSEDHLEIALDVNEDDFVVTSLSDLQEVKLDGDDIILRTEICNSEVLKREVNGIVIPNLVAEESHSVEVGDLSPRLTNLLMCGVVPESPIPNETSNAVKGCHMRLDLDNTSISLVESENDEVVKKSTPTQEIGLPQINLLNNCIEKCASVGEIQAPLTNLSTKSCSKDWILSSGEKSVSQPRKKLKRLRKVCDVKSGNEEIVGHPSVSGRGILKFYNMGNLFHGPGGREQLNDARGFLDDEAEASSEASDDEEVDDGDDSYGGSFIDDRINPTAATTQVETDQFDMMAIYRRSLLTQSPVVDFSPENMVSVDNPSLDTNGDGDLNANSSSVVILAGTTNETTVNKRRKLSFSQGGCGSLPICNLEKEVFVNPGKEMMDDFDDDFFQGIDFDALEEQASKQFRSKSNLKIQDLEAPSFDLGI